jgi:gluconolactonase
MNDLMINQSTPMLSSNMLPTDLRTDYRVLDPRFSKLIIGHAKLERIWSGARWVEGPAYFAAGRYLVFSDIPNNRMMRFDETSGAVSVFREPSNNSNGNTVDREGRLVSCEHRSRSITRTEHNGRISTLATHFEGRRFNSPNDVVVHSDGSIWFSDPTYGIDSDYEGDAAQSELDGACNVYRLDPGNGKVTAMVTDRVRPNGLAFSPDESILYVSDTGASHRPGNPRALHSYSIMRVAGKANAKSVKKLGKSKLVFEIERGSVDGFRCDVHGNIWTSSPDSVRCFAPDGTPLGAIAIPELVSNVCFGGIKKNRLFITGQTSLYSIFLKVNGA